jgi:hypothetical protein
VCSARSDKVFSKLVKVTGLTLGDLDFDDIETNRSVIGSCESTDMDGGSHQRVGSVPCIMQHTTITTSRDFGG